MIGLEAARHMQEQLTRQMHRAAIAAGREIILAGVIAQQGNQFRQGARGQVLIDQHDHRDLPDIGGGDEIRDRIKRQAVKQRAQARMGDGGVEDGLAILRRLADQIRADHHARAGAVFHHQARWQEFGHFIRKQARWNIRGAAGGEGHHQPAGARGPGLRQGRAGKWRQRGSASQTQNMTTLH